MICYAVQRLDVVHLATVEWKPFST